MIAQLLKKELEEEIVVTLKMLALVPGDQLDWQPHQKSMTLGKLAGHLAEIPGWFKFCIEVDEVDFGTDPWESPKAQTGEEFKKIAEDFAKGSISALDQTNDDVLLNTRWVMKYHGHLVLDFTKYEAMRHSFGQMIHHRAQLGVYLRLLNIPIPGAYGPSADEMPG